MYYPIISSYSLRDEASVHVYAPEITSRRSDFGVHSRCPRVPMGLR